jgi:hypothetical protein
VVPGILSLIIRPWVANRSRRPGSIERMLGDDCRSNTL